MYVSQLKLPWAVRMRSVVTDPIIDAPIRIETLVRSLGRPKGKPYWQYAHLFMALAGSRASFALAGQQLRVRLRWRREAVVSARCDVWSLQEDRWRKLCELPCPQPTDKRAGSVDVWGGAAEEKLLAAAVEAYAGLLRDMENELLRLGCTLLYGRELGGELQCPIIVPED